MLIFFFFELPLWCCQGDNLGQSKKRKGALQDESLLFLLQLDGGTRWQYLWISLCFSLDISVFTHNLSNWRRPNWLCEAAQMNCFCHVHYTFLFSFRAVVYPLLTLICWVRMKNDVNCSRARSFVTKESLLAPFASLLETDSPLSLGSS